MEHLLENYYYNINEPTSFLPEKFIIKKFSSDHEDAGPSKSDVYDWYSKQLAHLVYKPLRKKYFKNPIVSKYKDHIWHADLIELAKPEQNNGVKFLLIIIDNLSKYVWIRKLANKKQETVTAALRDVTESNGRKPHILGCDYGKEFNNRTFKAYLAERNINMYMMYAPDKASIIERFNQTFKLRLYRYLFYNNTNRFIDVIDQIVDNYNNTVHSRTKFKPSEVTDENQWRVY